MGVITERRGPVFYTAFNPLCTVIVAILGSIIFAEEMNLGRLIVNHKYQQVFISKSMYDI